MRTSNGCWTCRLRRKKCDEGRPVCEVCAALDISCHNDQNHKPEWMDGGVKQEDMAEQLKREVKENARRRRGDSTPIPGASIGESIWSAQNPSKDPTTQTNGLMKPSLDVQNDETMPSTETTAVQLTCEARCTLVNKDDRESITFERSDTILLMFYLENLLPFLFPFYRPSLLQGGRAWLLELMISSPLVRQATLCQSSYFFSLARGIDVNGNDVWEQMLRQTTDAIRVLSRAIQLINGSSITEHLHGAVRIMASIMQVQRFEITVLSFCKWQSHLNAARTLFQQLLDTVVESGEPHSRFNAVMSRLGPTSTSSQNWLGSSDQILNAEQAAFSFTSALVILDDVIASTTLQEQPRLYQYHHSLLCGNEETQEPVINLEAVFGLKNWILVHIGETATLEAWLQQLKAAGKRDTGMQRFHRATKIKDGLITSLIKLDTDPTSTLSGSLLDVFTPPPSQSSLVTRVWAHAALLYLSTVMSGWQPASTTVRYHVSRVIELLKRQESPTLLRTMLWPFCVAGFLAEPAQEAHFRGMVEVLQPPSIFGTVHKALELMENVWRNRDTEFAAQDLATCFRTQKGLVLLV